MKCSLCGAPNNSEAVFCSQCGSKLGVPECPICMAVVEPGSRFCSKCGAKLTGSGDNVGIPCQSCGYSNPAGTIYCKQCNQKIL